MNRVLAVTFFTFRELVRSKLLYIWLGCLALACFFSYFLSKLSFGDEVKIFTDLGLVGMELSGFLVLFLSLAVTYGTEMDQKAIFLQLTKPLTRGEYLLGRILGLFGVNVLVMAGMGGTVSILAFLAGGDPFPPLYLESAVFLVAEMFVLTALGMTLQVIATSLVAVVLYTLGAVFLGHFVVEIQWILETDLSTFSKVLFKSIAYVLPNLEAFNLKDRLYDPGLAGIPWGDLLFYTFSYSFTVFLIGWIVLEKREFK